MIFLKKQLIEGELKYICQVGDCQVNFADKSNAIRHLRNCHVQKYTEIQSYKNRKKDGNTIELRVKVDPNEILKSCVSLLTVHALPLCAVEYPAFKTLLSPFVESLKSRGIKLAITQEKMKKHIDVCADKITKIIIEEMKGKLVCLLVDIASRYNRSILGVNASFMIDGKLTIRTIGMHVLHCSHTAINLFHMIQSDLAKFELSMNQVLAVTTDNGKNLLKAVALLDAEFQSNQSMNSGCDQTEFDDSDCEINDEIFDEDYYADMLTQVRTHFGNVLYKDLIHGISCAAHTLQLVVNHGLEKCADVGDTIKRARILIIRLRTPIFVEMLKERGLNMAILDVKTRWNTIYTMVNIISLFAFLQTIIFRLILSIFNLLAV